MINRSLFIALFFTVLFQAGCSYRFVDPFPASDYALVSVRNATGEAGLAAILEDEMRRNGGFKNGSANRLSVTVTAFNEMVESVGSSGSPVRQKLSMDVAWKVQGAGSEQATFGSEAVYRSYPYSADLAKLDWNREAAVRLLSEKAALAILEHLGVVP